MNTLNPIFLCAVCVSLYWLIVVIKVFLITPKIGKAPNVIPKEVLGALSRLVMLPLLLCWIFLPWQAFFLHTSHYNLISWLGAGLAIFALGMSCYCWYYMGSSWRIGIDPKETNDLVTQGPFKYMRHPIYSLSMLLVFACFLGIQTKLMFVVLCIHWLLFIGEACREERYLYKVHGDNYAEYVRNSNRFLPRLKELF